MRGSERMSAILERLAADGSVDVGSLARGMGVSAATVRRDLQRLEAQHLLSRTHGGAVAADVSYELPLRYRTTRHHAEKRRIAAEAATRVLDGMTVGFTGGTTTTQVAREIVGRRNLTVVTNALNIAAELAIRGDLKLVVTGGTVRPESYELVGPLAERSLRQMHLDLAFVGADGIDVGQGLTTHHEIEAQTDRTLMEQADRAIVVADASKLGHVAFASIASLSDIDELITGGAAGAPNVRRLTDAGVVISTV